MDAYDYESLAGRVVLVTGGGSGLGAAICDTLARDGAHVAVVDINEASSHAVADEIGRGGGKAQAFTMDVGNEQAVIDSLENVVSRFGRLDAIINNAGVDVTIGIREMRTEDWHRVMATNLTGPFLLAKHGLAHLAPGGHIVNIASTAARRAWPNASAYHASKWGLMGLTHALHAELRGTGVKVSAVIAGGMRTPFLLDRFPDIDVELLQDPHNVARAVKFVLTQPPQTVIPEVMVLPMKETSWP
ncbi:SDR family oxidoreductase [Parapusillimonas granuli]|uniref:SDR family oxidoreductase n=1 Tax=Parapusillimonas granuli TaxID=380911 RepID=A0A853FUS4_9BURK|nr:SDR family oxidoreductase [Parapusillimonas granuli]MBB5213661.1 NAD(P)-dependent dehydrogenase (short-subunit alcohol dehydrogenase family) [Parapusillimonas granuli]MEB2398753.1 SDR family NAD(P)-dependent oxidoreductase [Alcaligenaceae bacterium]NYT48498.1 SDR family oxidoreductase [Parapusillimonas granuli]